MAIVVYQVAVAVVGPGGVDGSYACGASGV